MAKDKDKTEKDRIKDKTEKDSIKEKAKEKKNKTRSLVTGVRDIKNPTRASDLNVKVDLMMDLIEMLLRENIELKAGLDSLLNK